MFTGLLKGGGKDMLEKLRMINVIGMRFDLAFKSRIHSSQGLYVVGIKGTASIARFSGLYLFYSLHIISKTSTHF